MAVERLVWQPQQGQCETADFGRATSNTLSVRGRIWTIESSEEISERKAWSKANHDVDCDFTLCPYLHCP